MYRGAPSQNKPSPAQMQEMFAAFKQWKEKFKANILDMGSKLKSSGKLVTASGVTDGPLLLARIEAERRPEIERMQAFQARARRINDAPPLAQWLISNLVPL